MSEEQQEQSGGSSIKNIIIGLVSTVTLGIGGFITNKLTGGDDKEATPAAAAAPVINITNSNQQQQSAGGTKVIERVVEKPAAQPKPAPAKKKEGDEFKEEAPKW
jgi:outer membrane scaffolding protein for murein synthesis (MipA/OmpV family)